LKEEQDAQAMAASATFTSRLSQIPAFQAFKLAETKKAQ
jgi:hypothetical protein